MSPNHSQAQKNGKHESLDTHQSTYDYHVHLYGTLTPNDIFELGKDRYQDPALESRLAWCEQEFQRVMGRPLCIRDYWQQDDGYERLCQDYLMAEAGNFEVFQAKFNLLIALFGILDPQDLTVPRHIFMQQMQAGISGAEYRMVAPLSLDQKGLRTFFHGLCRLAGEFHELSAGAYQPSIALSLARDTLRCASDFALAQEIKQGPYGHYLRAIDFCQAEAGFPPSGKAKLIQNLIAANRSNPELELKVLYHVGETFSGMSLMSSVRWVLQAALLGCHRLGHCLSLGFDASKLLGQKGSEPLSERVDHLKFLETLDDQTLLKLNQSRTSLKAERERLQSQPQTSLYTFIYDEACLDEIKTLQNYALQRIKDETEAVIEVCPSSNLRIGALQDLSEHPIWRFQKAGMRWVIGSDDPGLFATNLQHEWEILLN